MVQHKPSSPSAKKSLSFHNQEDLIKQRLTEMDDAYHKQLRTLTNMVRVSRLNIRKGRHP